MLKSKTFLTSLFLSAFMISLSSEGICDAPPEKVKMIKREVIQLSAQAAGHGAAGPKGRALARKEIETARGKLAELKSLGHEEPTYFKEQEEDLKEIEEMLG